MNQHREPFKAPRRCGRDGGDLFEAATRELRRERPLRKPELRRIAADICRGQYLQAEGLVNAFMVRHPDDLDALFLMAQVRNALDRPGPASWVLQRCLELDPDFMAARYTYAKVIFRLRKFTDALGQVDRLLCHSRRNPLFRQLKADILCAIGEDEQALEILRDLTAENPERSECWLNYGEVLCATGFRAEGIVAYRRAIGCQPSCISAWWRLANLKNFDFDEPDVAAMKQELKAPDLATEDRVSLFFALGKALEDRHHYAPAFEYYAKGNAARRADVSHDWGAVNAGIARIKQLFTRDFMTSRSQDGCESPDPIFILGRPRSGSTLIEQILASHSAIEATAELPYIADIAFGLERGRNSQGTRGYPDILEELDAGTLAALGKQYLESAGIHRMRPRPFFIDKNPINYYYVGLILLILPNAKIIDARRNPAACCLSMFKLNLNLRLEELGRVYRNYLELMAHFDRVVPGRILRVFYERMVADPEFETKRLLEYLGVPFEESCMRFYETKRTIRTPSSEQVRRPISCEAVAHWQNFEPWLGPLAESLGDALLDYPSVPEELR